MEMIKLTINGREVTGKKGDTILTIAAQNGIDIPNLCYNKNLKIYGSCGLCVVEAEDFNTPLRSRTPIPKWRRSSFPSSAALTENWVPPCATCTSGTVCLIRRSWEF